MRIFILHIFLFFLLFFSSGISNAQNQFKSEDELLKQAELSFKEENYVDALPLYSQLVSLYPQNYEYNYKYGVSLIYADSDKNKSIKYLEWASKQINIQPEVFYFLGKSYHLNSLFDKAIASYQKFKEIATEKLIIKYSPDREIEMCLNGKAMNKDLAEVVVMSKKDINEQDFFRSYDLADFGGKLIVKPDEFKTSLDVKKKEKTVIFLPNGAQEIFFSSYGEDDKSGKDIYRVRRLPNGQWAKPFHLGNVLNTSYDEDFPFYNSQTKVLYFSSKGHKSIGGYDVFQSFYDEENNTWSPPLKVEVAINSTEDDVLYITDPDEKVAFYSTGSTSVKGKTSVYKVKIDNSLNVAVIKGFFKMPNSKEVMAHINVRNVIDNSVVGIFKPNPISGEYLIVVPDGQSYVFHVETENFAMESEVIDIPYQIDLITLKQEMEVLEKEGSTKLVIRNLFDKNYRPSDDSNAITMAMKTDKGDTHNENLNESIRKQDAIVEEKSSMSNNEVINIAYNDAEEIKKEAIELKEESEYVFAFANHKKDFSQLRKKEADIMMSRAREIVDVKLKQEKIVEANTLLNESDKLAKEAIVALNLAENIDKESKGKLQEAEMSLKYAKDLEGAVKSNSSKESLNRLKAQKKGLESNTIVKSSEELTLNNLKEKAEEKKIHAAKYRSKAIELEIQAQDITNEIEENNLKLSKAKKSDEQEEIKIQIESLKEELDAVTKKVEENYFSADKLEFESSVIESQVEVMFNLIDELKSVSDAEKSNITSKPANKFDLSTEIAALEKEKNIEAFEKINNTKNITIENESFQESENENIVLVDQRFLSILDEKGAIKDYKIDFIDKLDRAELISDKLKKEEVKKVVFEEWVVLISNEIEYREQNLKKLDKNLQKEEKKKIESLRVLIKEKNTSINQANINISKAKKSTEVTNENIAENKNNSEKNNSVNSDNGKPTISKTETEILSANNETVSNEKRENEKNAVNNSDNIFPANDKSQINSYSTDTVTGNVSISKVNNSEELKDEKNLNDKEVLKVNSNFLAESSQPKKDKEETLIETNQSVEELASGTNRSESNQEQLFNESLELGKDNSINPELTRETTSSGISQKLNTQQYSSDIAMIEKKKGENNLVEVKNLEQEAFKIRQEASLINNPKEREEALNKASSIDTQAQEKRFEAFSAFSLANQSEFAANETQVAKFETTFKEEINDTALLAIVLLEEARSMMSQAFKIKETASKNPNQISKHNAFEKANDKEQLALARQHEAIKLFETIKPLETIISQEIVTGEVKDNINFKEPSSSSIAADSNSSMVSETNSKKDNGSNQLGLNENSQEIIAKNQDSTRDGTFENSDINNKTTQQKNTYEPGIENNQKNTNSENSSLQTDIAKIKNTPELEFTNTLALEEFNKGKILEKESKETSEQADILDGLAESTKKKKDKVKYEEQSSLLKGLAESKLEESNSSYLKAAELQYGKTFTNELANNKEEGNLDKKVGANSGDANLRTSNSDKGTIAKTMDSENALSINNSNSNNPLKPENAFINNSENVTNEQITNVTLAKNEEIPSNKINVSESDSQTNDLKTDSQNANIVQNNAITFDGNVTNSSESKTINSIENSLVLPITEDESIKKTSNNQLSIANNETSKTDNTTDISAGSKVKPNDNNSEFVNSINQAKQKVTIAENNLNENVDSNLKTNNAISNNEPQNISDNSLNPNSQINTNSQLAENSTNILSNETKVSIAENVNLKVEEAVSTPINSKSPEPVFAKPNPANPFPMVKPEAKRYEMPKVLETEIFDLTTESFYNENNPIPLDPPLPEGLIFKVQIGAFRNPIQQDLFKSFAPLMAENTQMGFKRYTAGMFKAFETAQLAKDVIRGNGYADAFIVAFLNGKRISIAEARGHLNENLSSIDNSKQNFTNYFAESGVGIGNKSGENTVNSTQKQIQTPSQNKPVTVLPQDKNISFEEGATLAKYEELPLAQNRLLYTVQVGVYSKPVTSTKLFNIQPLYVEKLANGLLRYTSGIYTNIETVRKAKDEIRRIGISDAFVRAYINGKLVTEAEATSFESSSPNITNNKTNDNLNKLPVVNSQINDVNNSSENSNIISDGKSTKVESSPQIFSMPGSTSGLIYTVQIGAFREAVPENVKNTYDKLSGYGISNYKNQVGITVYTLGGYKNYNEANDLKNEIKNQPDLSDVFVKVFYNGKPIAVSEALAIESGKIPSLSNPENSSSKNKEFSSANNTGLENKSTIGNIESVQISENIILENKTGNNTQSTDVSSTDNPVLIKTEVKPEIEFKILLGEYKEEVPNDIASVYLKLADRGINHYINENGLTVYTVGVFDIYKEADDMKTDLRNNYKLKDAKVISFNKGLQIPLEEALKILNGN